MAAILTMATLATSSLATGTTQSQRQNDLDIVWSSLGKDENDSMPIGNGDVAANVWTEQNGDIVILLAKSDAWTEAAAQVKLGRVRIRLSPNPFGTSQFSQSLHLGSATVQLKSGDSTVRIWADANHPTIHIDGTLAQPADVEAVVEFWRPNNPFRDNLSSTSLPSPPDDEQRRTSPDIVFPATSNRIAWAHYNTTSLYPYVLKKEHLEDCIAKYPDPLLHRSFGAAVVGEGLVSRSDKSLQSKTASREVKIEILALTQKQCASPGAWLEAMEALAKTAAATELQAVRSAHESWWRDFWNRSWIHVSGAESAQDVSQGYAVQRYLMACSSRGETPTKHNGGLFTVGHDLSDAAHTQTPSEHDPDWRKWGGCYWNQNNRLLYWPLIATGDIDLLNPWFDMYVNALPMAIDRTRTYYHHAGAHFPETLYFWGLPKLSNFGTNNPSYEIQNRWQRYHIQGSLEVISQMQEVYEQTLNPEFARTELVPFAEAIVTFYDQHYPRNIDGQITLVPAQSLETYQLDAANPCPDIAGLRSVIPRLLKLPVHITTEAQRQSWEKLLKQLPPLPMGTTTKGKLPPYGSGERDGIPTILPAEHYGKTRNGENPELYIAFPYRLFGVGKPGLELARGTFAARLFPQDTCWGQDGPQAAVLGFTDIAQKAATAAFTHYGDQRFRWFWKAAHDWIPDLDNGGDGMITLQLMIMHCDDRRIQLLSAWPNEWSADFKLHAPYQTTVEGHVENGKLTNLVVTPAERAKDVVIVPRD